LTLAIFPSERRKAETDGYEGTDREIKFKEVQGNMPKEGLEVTPDSRQ
jgi:hypothetical protein